MRYVTDPFVSDRLYLDAKDMVELLSGGMLKGNGLVVAMNEKLPISVLSQLIDASNLASSPKGLKKAKDD